MTTRTETATTSLYDSDTSAWATEQADAIRRRAFNEIDWQNVAEEIEDLARRERRRIYGQLVTACTHLLKWEHQPEMRSNSWRAAVVKARGRIAKLVRDNPSEQHYPAAALAEAYHDARPIAEAETGLSGLPVACPWTIEQVLDHAFWPGGE